MDASKEYLKKHGVMPFISFADGKAHTVKLVNEKPDTMNTQQGPKEGMKYLVEEGGEKKSFFSGSISLIQQLSAFQKGDEVVIQMVRKNINGQMRSAYTVKRAGEETVEEPVEEVPPPTSEGEIEW